MNSRTAATVLGVSPGASKQEISRAFRARAKDCHPDAAGSNEAFVLLREAFDLLHVLAPDSSQIRRPSAAPWFRPAPVSSIDLTDTPTRPHRQVAATTAAKAQAPRDGKGRRFADVLDAELSR